MAFTSEKYIGILGQSFHTSEVFCLKSQNEVKQTLIYTIFFQEALYGVFLSQQRKTHFIQKVRAMQYKMALNNVKNKVNM